MRLILGKARPGKARQGTAWQGKAGKAGNKVFLR